MELYKIVLSLAPAHETATCNLYHTRHETCDWGAEGEVLLYICAYAAIYVSSSTIYVSSYYYICFFMLLCVSSHYYMCPDATTYESSYYYIYVLILRYMCPHTTLYSQAARLLANAPISSLLSTLYYLLLSTRYYYLLATTLLSPRYSLLSPLYYYYLLATTICSPTLLSPLATIYSLLAGGAAACQPS